MYSNDLPTGDIKFCCDAFPGIAKSFNWMRSTDGVFWTMPYMFDRDVDSLWRVNYCPSCGKEVRGITMLAEQYTQLP